MPLSVKFLTASCIIVSALCSTLPAAAEDIIYTGDCGASSAIANSANSFLVIGDEYPAALRLYRVDGMQLDTCNIQNLLSKDDEADLEASAMRGDTLFIIGSHGRNNSGKRKKARQQLIGLKVEGDEKLKVKQVGSPYTKLMEHLLSDDRYKKFHLDKDVEEDLTLAPKDGGTINIEGMACDAKGDSLLIGLRSPQYKGKAIVIPVTNPMKLIVGEEMKPVFKDPILVDLGGQGIRSFEYWKENKTFIIVSGNFSEKRGFQVFTWSGDENEQPIRIYNGLSEKSFNPEGLVLFPEEKSKYLLLSDDGALFKTKTKDCSDWPENERKFRGRLLSKP